MMPRRALITTLLCLTACSTTGSTRPITHEGITTSPTDDLVDGRSGIFGATETTMSDRARNTVGTDPTAERAIGYVAIVAGVAALTIVFIGFYKLARLLAH